MTHCKSLKDVLAEHVGQLPDMEDHDKPVQPAFVSNHASRRSAMKGNKIMDSYFHASNGGSPLGFASSPTVSTCESFGPELLNFVDSPASSGTESPTERPVSWSTTSGDLACTAEEVLPHGSNMQWTRDEPAFLPDPCFSSTKDENSDGSQQLEHAAHLLTAAVANWQACAQWGATRNSTQVLEAEQPKAMADARTLAMTAAMSSPTSHGSAPVSTLAPPPAFEKPAALMGKGLSDISGSLPTEVVRAVHDLLRQEGRNIQEEDDRMQAVRRLREQLERQQEESAQKIMMMMQDQMARAAATQPMPRAVSNWHVSGAAAKPPMGMMPAMPWTSEEGVWGHTIPGGAYDYQPRSPQGCRVGPNEHGGGFAKLGASGRNYRRNGVAAFQASGDDVSLSKHLRELEKIEPERVVLVRKINQLGLESPKLLRTHYSKYGKVDRVLVAHSKYKVPGCAVKLRPSGLGFIVMNKKEEASAVFAQGQEQFVSGGPDQPAVNIRVQRFQHYAAGVKDVDSPVAGN
mmetsp:Transcript_129415/g.228829  ORF Transcript_129415/g.228829 Transcript_129415/m.228829 type:complete len:517 (-) Transcript_129415:83-1633(-)